MLQACRQTSLLEAHNLSFSFPAHPPLLSSFSCALGCEKVGLIGDNGSGKTTLLRLFAGELRPSSGSIVAKSELFFLKQSHRLDLSLNMADLLGVSAHLSAWERVRQGCGTEDDFALLDGHWDIAERIKEMMESVGLSHISYQRKLSEMSGGQITLLSLAAGRLSGAPIMLMDEPSNNLDAHSRAILYKTIDAHKGLTLIATHDRALLRRMDKIIELHDGKGMVIDGGYDVYLAHVTSIKESSERRLKEAQQELNRVKKQQ